MKYRTSLSARIALFSLLVAVLFACDNNTSNTANGSAEMPSLHITGKLAYRARIALPPDSIAQVNLLDISIADRASETITSAQIPLQGKQVPIDFELTVAAESLKERNRYSVRATINRADGTLLWTTDTTNPVSTTQDTDLGTLRLVQVGAGRKPTASASSTPHPLQNVTWVFNNINGQASPEKPRLFIKFSEDAVSGNAGCNQFTGSYRIKDSELTLGPLAATLRACVPGLDATEHALLSILNDVNTFEINEESTLTLTTEDGRTVTATKAPD